MIAYAFAFHDSSTANICFSIFFSSPTLERRSIVQQTTPTDCMQAKQIVINDCTFKRVSRLFVVVRRTNLFRYVLASVVEENNKYYEEKLTFLSTYGYTINE